MNGQNEAQLPQFPTISEAMIVELNNRWPEMCADLSWETKQVWFAAGQRSVIRFLNAIFNEQQQNALKG